MSQQIGRHNAWTPSTVRASFDAAVQPHRISAAASMQPLATIASIRSTRLMLSSRRCYHRSFDRRCQILMRHCCSFRRQGPAYFNGSWPTESELRLAGSDSGSALVTATRCVCQARMGSVHWL